MPGKLDLGIPSTSEFIEYSVVLVAAIVIGCLVVYCLIACVLPDELEEFCKPKEQKVAAPEKTQAAAKEVKKEVKKEEDKEEKKDE